MRAGCGQPGVPARILDRSFSVLRSAFCLLPSGFYIWLVVAVAGIACLPQTLTSLHESRLGHRAAGEFLAGQNDPSGAVLDTQGWTGLYSGRETRRFGEARAALGDPRLGYLVLEERELQYPSGRSRTLRRLIQWAAEPVAEFPDPATRKPNQEPVLVYRWHAERFSGRSRAAGAGSTAVGGTPARAAPASALSPSARRTVVDSSPVRAIPTLSADCGV